MVARPLDFTVRHRQEMRHFGPVTLAAVLAFAATSVLAMDFGGYSVVKLHPGLNNLDLSFAGHPVSVVIGHRENFNAHSSDVVTFYLWDRDPSRRLDIVGLWDKEKEELSLQVSGGADCLLHDFRLLRSKRAGPPELVVADRPLLKSYADNGAVSFKFYVLKQSTEGIPGRPPFWFELVATQTSREAYCDVGVALSRELGLGDYRAVPRPEGSRNSPQPMSNDGSKGL